MKNILIADDNIWFLEAATKKVEEKISTHRVTSATSEKECLKKLRSKSSDFDVVVLDLSFTKGKMEGYRLIGEAKKYFPDSLVIMLTTYNSKEIIAKCMLLGADDFVSKGHINFVDILSERITTCLERKNLDRKEKWAGLSIAEQRGLKFRSKKMNEIFSQIAKIKSDPSFHTLILGEAGVGKEFVAESISRINEKRPFFAINASCLGRDLLESELFGHEKGAFTGADKLKRGLFELANGGDIFIDEIATLSLDHQAKLLRVVQKGEFFRVGSEKLLTTNARVITATNQDLEKMVENGSFREDLLQRLSRFVISVPPLRDRVDDIQPISQTILSRLDRSNFTISVECMRLLEAYHWPRNVRELEDLLREMTLNAASDILGVGDLPRDFFKKLQINPPTYDFVFKANFDDSFESVKNQFEVQFLNEAAKRIENPTGKKLGEALGVPKSTMEKKLRSHGIRFL